MKRDIGYILFSMLMAVVVLTACGSGSDIIDDDNNVDAPKPLATSNEEIRVNTNVTGMLTRANTIDDDSELQGYDLKIDAYFHGTNTAYLSNQKLHYASSWKFWDGSAQLHYYWPIEGSVYDPSSANITVSSLDFVGSCPFTAPAYITSSSYAHASGASFSCDVSSYMTNTAQSSMQEYLIAVLNTQTYTTQTAAGGALPLTFKHPFALIKFVIAEGSGTHVKVNSISIADLYTTATCTYNGSAMTWSSLSGSTAMSQTGLNLKYDTETTETTPFIVIPNNYGSKTLTVNGTWDDWSAVTKDISTDVDFNWQPGYIYTYTLTVTKYALKVDKSKFTEQW